MFKCLAQIKQCMFMIPTAAYPNNQQAHIHIQSRSCNVIHTSTLHLEMCFSSDSALKNITLRIVSRATVHWPAANYT